MTQIPDNELSKHCLIMRPDYGIENNINAHGDKK